MSTLIGDNAFLHELELDVRTELTLPETGQPEAEADSATTVEWLLDPAITRHGASGIVARAGLSRADRCRILALPYPVDYQVFWQALADLGVTREGLMDRMGASP
jgi:hypothetical protein